MDCDAREIGEDACTCRKCLMSQVEGLRAKIYRLRRAHELLLTFNWKPLWYDRNVGVEGIIETMLNYSRTALGVEPLWDGFRRRGKGIPVENLESLISKLEEERAYPPYLIKKAAEYGCPDKVEPKMVGLEEQNRDVHLVVPLNPEGQEAFKAAAERMVRVDERRVPRPCKDDCNCYKKES